MKAKKKSFDEICDVFALRVIVSSIDECYRMVGVIHRLWRPRHRRFKDYIAAPKNNHYQSLHTTVFGLNGRPTEFQVRTKEMDEEANYGIASHWHYKHFKKKVPPWIQELLVRQQEYKNDEEFFNKFSSEILNNRIYVYTPKGDVISLPAGATPVDFAYHIHTEIGNKCAGAVVNDIEVALNHQLATNDVVQILLDRTRGGPDYNWLNFVKTNAAKKHIENYFNRTEVERRFRL
jgi:GTP pyrophosphokinase